MRLTALAVAAAAIALGAHRVDAQPVDRWPGAAAAYVVEVDGAERWSHDASARLRPASLTKILTALVVMESAGDDELVAVSAHAAAAQGARIGLRRGMQVPVGDLMTAMLLRSANDACLALVSHVARTEKSFVAQMNARAAALGLVDSQFENACGFDGPRHRASARDLGDDQDALQAEIVDLLHLDRSASRHVVRELATSDTLELRRVGLWALGLVIDAEDTAPLRSGEVDQPPEPSAAPSWVEAPSPPSRSTC